MELAPFDSGLISWFQSLACCQVRWLYAYLGAVGKVSLDAKKTKADISAGIKNNIASESKKASDGKFHVTHEGKDLALDLVKVHDDRLSGLGDGKYFACVDMKAADGTTYDIDFFMSGKPGDMKVTETSVHKVNGKPLYTWKEEGGVWKKVPKS